MAPELFTMLWKGAPLPDITPSTRLVLLDLAWRADESGSSWPSVETIANDVKVTSRTVRQALQSLRDVGVLSCLPHEGRGDTNLYNLNVPMLTKLCDEEVRQKSPDLAENISSPMPEVRQNLQGGQEKISSQVRQKSPMGQEKISYRKNTEETLEKTSSPPAIPKPASPPITLRQLATTSMASTSPTPIRVVGGGLNGVNGTANGSSNGSGVGPTISKGAAPSLWQALYDGACLVLDRKGLTEVQHHLVSDFFDEIVPRCKDPVAAIEIVQKAVNICGENDKPNLKYWMTIIRSRLDGNVGGNGNGGYQNGNGHGHGHGHGHGYGNGRGSNGHTPPAGGVGQHTNGFSGGVEPQGVDSELYKALERRIAERNGQGG